jgi:hypothetical protein
MNPRRDAATVPAASPAPSPERPPASPPVDTPEPPPEDVLVRYARLGHERAVRRGRYVAGGFVGITRPGAVPQQDQTALMLAHQASLAAMAASGGLRIESGGAVTDNRFEAFQQEQAARQYVEHAMRDQIGRRIPGKGMMR